MYVCYWLAGCLGSWLSRECCYWLCSFASPGLKRAGRVGIGVGSGRLRGGI